MATCPDCGAEVVECTVCSGSGTVNSPAGAAQQCGQCGGKGFIDATKVGPHSCHE